MQFKHLFLTITFFLNLLLASFAQEPTLLDHGGGVRTVEFSPVDASLLASAGESHIIKLWNLQNDTVRILNGHTNRVNSVAFSPNGQFLASVSDDRTLRLWNVESQQNIVTRNLTDRYRSIAFSPDGQLLATGGGRHVKLWNARHQTEIATLQHNQDVRTVAFSHDGQLLAAGDGSGDGPGTVQVWDVKSRQIVVSLNANPKNVKANVTSLAVDTADEKLYWMEKMSDRTGKIRRANLDGTNVELVKNLTSAPRGITVDSVNGKMYLTNSWGKIQRLNVDGSNFQPNLITGLQSPKEITVDVVDAKLYWTEQRRIRRANLNGENIQDIVIGLGAPTGVTLGMPSAYIAIPAAPATIIVPEQTLILANYPTPFNPETWIPYQLSAPADVSISIYAADGRLIRTLDLGHQPVGNYESQSRAAYWDGRNALGEPVASGIYFYTLTAGEFNATRKMLIMK